FLAGRQPHVGFLALALEKLQLVPAFDLTDPLPLAARCARDVHHQLLDHVDRLGTRALPCEGERKQAERGGGSQPASCPVARFPCCFSSARMSGRRPRTSTKASSASRLPPRARMASRKRCAVSRSNTPFSSKAANASAARTSAHL